MTEQKFNKDSLVQYIVIRKDLHGVLNWPWGAVIGQACHASVCSIEKNRECLEVQEYLKDINCMHKVVLQVEDEESLLKLSSKLRENNIAYNVWIEQPENIPTCLATAPGQRNKLKPLFKGYQLFF